MALFFFFLLKGIAEISFSVAELSGALKSEQQQQVPLTTTLGVAGGVTRELKQIRKKPALEASDRDSL